MSTDAAPPAPLPVQPDGSLHLGERIDPAGHTRTGKPVVLDPAGFTTHGVIVGMTGSGKTGLGVVLLEEALLNGVPALIIDPKGDLPNLLLSFPALAPADFAPWVEGADPAAVAQQWRDGLAGWGIGPERIAALRQRAAFTIVTPGSENGVPLNLIGSLRNPGLDDEADRHDEIDGVVAGLLGLMGIESDPLAGREHILLANLIDRAWAAGQDLDLAALVSQVQDPPLRKLGVLDLDTFYPAKDRTALMLKLNGLLASPSFASWATGIPLDIEQLLWERAADGSRGRPRCVVVSIAHLSDEERQFAVTVLLGRLISWMRKQPGTAGLRALVYFDEVMGFVPPTAVPPTKKPVLTLLKQARAFGVGLVLATQNPVDLDYKAISNAGTWMVGRLQTERDRDRLLDGMRSVAGGVDIGVLAATISGLGKREFVLHRSGSATPEVFSSRWAMSYLRGPLTGEQIRSLTAADPLRRLADDPNQMTTGTAPGTVPATGAAAGTAGTASPASGAGGADATLADDETRVPPPAAEGTLVYFAAPDAPWLAEIGAVPTGTCFEAAVVARLRLLYDDDRAGLRHAEEWECVATPLGNPFDPGAAVHVDYDGRDLRTAPPAGAVFRLPEADIAKAAWWRGADKALKDHLVTNLSMTVRRNPVLGVWSRPDETAEAFANRCEVVADDKADQDAAKYRATMEARIDRVRDAVEEARRRAEVAQEQKKGNRMKEMLGGAGDLISVFMGGKRRARSLGRVVRGASSRRSQAGAAAARAEAASERAADKVEDLNELEQELADRLFEIDAEWSEKAKQVETVEIPLERTDITVQELALCWIPVR